MASAEGAVGTEGKKSQELGDLGGYEIFHKKGLKRAAATSPYPRDEG